MQGVPFPLEDTVGWSRQRDSYNSSYLLIWEPAVTQGFNAFDRYQCETVSIVMCPSGVYNACGFLRAQVRPSAVTLLHVVLDSSFIDRRPLLYFSVALLAHRPILGLFRVSHLYTDRTDLLNPHACHIRFHSPFMRDQPAQVSRHT